MERNDGLGFSREDFGGSECPFLKSRRSLESSLSGQHFGETTGKCGRVAEKLRAKTCSRSKMGCENA